ncbi:hypothetical protein [Rubrivirga marina]|uniref:Uncharacterized protein n=1 Tax=Rubrivirga marina TaxID=1196024 RepID=A0A271J288_9BACT|nr:hypothetical protein [Rubrivirga marina]PAP77378.1 hypothetical protein BSZ37_13505 [Rubrivirga marina]
MRRIVSLALLVVPVVTLAQAASPLPVTFLPGGAGAEGCYAQWSTRSAVHAYSAPTTVSTRLRTIDAERRIDANDYSESLTAVLEPGLVRARQDVRFQGAQLGTGRSEAIRLSRGDELTVLAAGPEESVYFAFGTAIYAGFVPGFYGGPEVEVIRQPVTELWVRLIEHDAERPASWINTAQAGVAPRESFCL